MPDVNHAIALRCIGQDLERRGLKNFTIRREGSHFVVTTCEPDSAPAAPPLRYTPADIEMMDRGGETQRGDQARREFLHPAQMLRAIGDYLDKYASTLVSVAYSDVELAAAPFKVEYLTREGEHRIEDRPGAAIFDECVLMFQKRSENAPTPNPAGRR